MTRVEILHEVYIEGGDSAVLTELKRNNYGEFTEEEIAQVFDTTTERIKNIKDRAIRKLHSPKTLIPYLRYLNEQVEDESNRDYGN